MNGLVNACIIKHGLESKRNELGLKQNNYVHNNGRSFLTDNEVSYNDNKRTAMLLRHVHEDITFVTSYFLTVLILIKPDYISSSDYIDFLDIGITPPNDCQYLVASIVQEYIDEFVVKIHPDLKAYLNKNNPCGMRIV